jgi:hypothetical protein
MKRAYPHPTHLRLAMFAAAMIFAAPAAHALTFETKNYTDDSYLRYSDPDKKVEQFLNNDGQATKSGGPTFHFNVGPAKEDLFTRGRGSFQPAWGPQALPDPR